jgi:hypothetical protein
MDVIEGPSEEKHGRDEGLIGRYAAIYSFDAIKLAAVLSQFGPLPKQGQEQLIQCLVPARMRYQLSTIDRKEGGLLDPDGRVTFTEERNQLDAIEKTTKNLLLQLGVNPAAAAPEPLWDQSERSPWEQLLTLGQQDEKKRGVTNRLAATNIDIADKDQIGAQLANAGNCVALAIIGLQFLHRQAKAAAIAARNRVSPGRGGSRNRPASRGQLARDAITIYAQMRQSFPASGPKPGFGRPMVRFVVAVSALFGTSLSDSEIQGAWRVRKSFLKEN